MYIALQNVSAIMKFYLSDGTGNSDNFTMLISKLFADMKLDIYAFDRHRLFKFMNDIYDQNNTVEIDSTYTCYIKQLNISKSSLMEATEMSSMFIKRVISEQPYYNMSKFHNCSKNDTLIIKQAKLLLLWQKLQAYNERVKMVRAT